MKIHITDDNERLIDRIRRRLPEHSIDYSVTGIETLRKASTIDYDLFILDLGLPDQNGSEICKKIRKLKIDTPILVLTGSIEKRSIVDLLSNGADDYLSKPFDNDELKARVEALGRRKVRKFKTPIIHHGNLTIDRSRRLVTRGDQVIHLRKKEFDILLYLLENVGRIMTRSMIMSHVWDEDRAGWTATVDVHIKHIRDKIDKPFNIETIRTAYGIGYFIDPMKEL